LTISLRIGSSETLGYFFRCVDSEFLIMKKSKVAISALWLFLFQGGELILPSSQSMLAKNIVVITKKERITRSANSYVKEGIQKGKYGNYKEAVIAFSQAILIDEFHSIAYYNRGVARMNLNDYEGAIFDYDKALEINPEYAIAYFNRGVTKFYLDDLNGAIFDYTKSIENNVNDAEGYLNRGLIYYEIGNDKFACQDFIKAASLGNQFASKLLNSQKGKWCRDSISDVNTVLLF